MTWQPNDNEQQSAQELDQLITALQHGKQLPTQDKDGQMAQQLMQLAATIQPEQPFVNSLRAQLTAQANQKSQSKKGVTRPSIIEEWVKQFTMKRTLITLAGVTAVIVIAVAGWNLFRPSGSPESTTEIAAVATTENGASQEVVEPETAVTQPGETGVIEQPVAEEAGSTAASDEPISPAFSGVRGQGGGGGDRYGFGQGQGPFTNAAITLNGQLPQEMEAAVYETTILENTTINQDEVRAFADKMGVSGEMYFEWYNGMPVDGQDDGSGNVPYLYRIFDGKRQVSAYLSGEMVYEDLDLFNQNLPPQPFADRAAIAEQFLQERNLLDFAYEIHPGWGNEVQFLPLFDGRPVNNWSLITVNVTSDSQIMSVNIRPLGDLNQIQTDSLRSAADAWQYLQDNFADGPVTFNLIASDPAYYAPPVVPGAEKTRWDREYAAGQEVTLNSWVQIFRPADGSIRPRMVTDRGILLAADDVTLEDIAQTVSNGNNVRLQGVLSGETDSLVLNVSNWEAITGPFDIYLNGTTRLINGVVSLELPGGFPIQIANPPTDLPIDSFVSMSSWSVRIADDGVSAITDWNAFDLMNAYIDPGIPVEDPFSNISGVTINKVELVYNYLNPYESLNPFTGIPYIADDNSHLIPVWRFTGETNKGDTVEFIVPAPANVELPTAPAE